MALSWAYALPSLPARCWATTPWSMSLQRSFPIRPVGSTACSAPGSTPSPAAPARSSTILLASGCWVCRKDRKLLASSLAGANRERLQRVKGVGESPPVDSCSLQSNRQVSEGRTVWVNESNSSLLCFYSSQHRGGL